MLHVKRSCQGKNFDCAAGSSFNYVKVITHGFEEGGSGSGTDATLLSPYSCVQVPRENVIAVNVLLIFAVQGACICTVHTDYSHSLLNSATASAAESVSYVIVIMAVPVKDQFRVHSMQVLIYNPNLSICSQCLQLLIVVSRLIIHHCALPAPARIVY